MGGRASAEDAERRATKDCPVCEAKLRAVEKYGVEVDICPDCKGMWLDRGELDKILAMAAGDGPQERESSPREHAERADDRRREDDDRRHGDQGHERGDARGGKKSPSSWLGDILGGFGEGGD
jgi:uncharacterized protein